MLVYLNSETWSCPTSQFFAAHVQRALDDGLEIAVVHELDGVRVRTIPCCCPALNPNPDAHIHCFTLYQVFRHSRRNSRTQLVAMQPKGGKANY